jgi:RNA 2',3'-cyclic 3'-phosphodiesterase
VRLFVAVTPPQSALDHLDGACAPLRPGHSDLRWTSQEAWHVTLAFLGEVSEQGAEQLAPRLERAARRHQRFSLAFAGAGAFPRPSRANVLWIGLSGDRKALGDLAASVAAAARRAGTPPPDASRRFQPHLTLARCRAPANVSSIVQCLEGYSGEPWGVAEIFLIRSYLPGGTVPSGGTIPPKPPLRTGELPAPPYPPGPPEPPEGNYPPPVPPGRRPRYEVLGQWALRTDSVSPGSGRPRGASPAPRA